MRSQRAENVLVVFVGLAPLAGDLLLAWVLWHVALDAMDELLRAQSCARRTIDAPSTGSNRVIRVG